MYIVQMIESIDAGFAVVEVIVSNYVAAVLQFLHVVIIGLWISYSVIGYEVVLEGSISTCRKAISYRNLVLSNASSVDWRKHHLDRATHTWIDSLQGAKIFCNREWFAQHIFYRNTANPEYRRAFIEHCDAID